MAAFALLFPFLAPQRRAAATAFTLMLGEAAVELSYPLFMARLIDRGILLQDMDEVLLWGGVMAALALLSFVFGISSTFFASDTGQSFARDLRAALFRRLMRAPQGVFERQSTAAMLTRLTSDVNQMQTAVFMSVRLYFRAPLIILAAVLLALAVDAELALVLLVATPLVALALAWTLNRGMQLFRLSQERLDRLTGLLRENVNGMMLIRAYGRHREEEARFAQAGDDLRRDVSAAMQLSETVVPALIMLLNLCILSILWSGHLRIAGGGISTGEVVAVLNYALRIIGEFAYLSMILTNLSMARSAMGRTADILSLPEEAPAGVAPAPAPMSPPALRAEALSFGRAGSHEAVLKQIEFDIAAGSMTVVMGATGAGKSTLLGLLLRLYEPGAGRLLFDGEDVARLSPAALRSRIGYVPQSPLLVAGSVADNLRWGRADASDAELAEAARQAQLHDLILSLPQGYATMLDARGGNLSGGQRQRLSIARALLRRPGLLLLDDCTSALDARTEAGLLAAIGELDCTVVLVTQKVAAARRADHVLLLDDGRLIAQGRHDELLAGSEAYREIVASQTRHGTVTSHA